MALLLEIGAEAAETVAEIVIDLAQNNAHSVSPRFSTSLAMGVWALGSNSPCEGSNAMMPTDRGPASSRNLPLKAEKTGIRKAEKRGVGVSRGS
jgi:hypothetical protein